MTGIAGFVRTTGVGTDTLLDGMANSIDYTKHARIDRWSDEHVGLCRVHLGIINPAPQPVFNDDKSIILIMDGEVFDYYKDYSTKDDAKHCITLYEKYGDHAFKDLNGSFSIAIYNIPAGELSLVTDRFSSRPLFYSLIDDPTAICFGSKLAAVLQLPNVRRELEVNSLFELLTIQRIIGTKTLYKNIQMVPPGTILKFRDGRANFNPYWKINYREVRRSERYYEDRLADALRRAVERRTRDQDHQYGLLLSGGLDSRAVLAAADKQLVTFTVAESQNREVRIARRMAQIKGFRHIFVRRTLDHYVKILDKAVELSDGLYAFDHAHFIGLLDRMSNECDVMLHGCFLDMLKGAHFPTRVIDIMGKRVGFPGAKLRTGFLVDSYLAGLSDEQFVKAIFDDSVRSFNVVPGNPIQVFRSSYSQQIVAHLREEIMDLLKDAREITATPSYMWDYMVLWNMLPNVLSFLHLSHIRAFMPERSVAFDNDLVDTYLEMPLKLKRSGKVYQKALNKLNPRVAAIPNSNTQFNPQIPGFLERVLIRGILGAIKYFVLPPSKSIGTERSWPNFAELLRQNVELKSILEETVNDPESIDPTIFDRDRILEMLQDHVNRKADYSRVLFLLLTFGRWQKKFPAKLSAAAPVS